MRPPQTLELSEQQRAELEDLRDHSPLPYLRERAAALLKVAAGMPPLEVARHGLLRPRDSDTIYRWLGRYRTQGLEGLRIRKGRGRKPAFSPSAR
jgi:transposase